MKLILGDCIEEIKKIDNKSIDFCIADFPYNISNYKNSITKKGNDFVKGDFGSWDKWNNMEDYLNWVFNISKCSTLISGRLMGTFSSMRWFFELEITMCPS